MRIVYGIAVALVAAAARALALSAQAPRGAERYWPQWRGPHANGVSQHREPAARVERNEEHPVEGRDPGPRLGVSGHLGRSRLRADRGSGRRAASPTRTRRAAASAREACIAIVVMALDRRDGRVVWERTAREEAPHEASHQDNGTWASARRSPTAST